MTPQGWCDKQIKHQKINCKDISLQGSNLTFKIRFHHSIQRIRAMEIARDVGKDSAMKNHTLYSEEKPEKKK